MNFIDRIYSFFIGVGFIVLLIIFAPKIVDWINSDEESSSTGNESNLNEETNDKLNEIKKVFNNNDYLVEMIVPDSEKNVNIPEHLIQIGSSYSPETGNWLHTYGLREITKQGGLGDTLNVLRKKYGDYKIEGTGRVSFQDGYITALITSKTDSPEETDLVWNISINFELTNDHSRTKNDALNIAYGLIPLDSEKISETTVELNEDYSTDVILYKSEELAKRIDVQDLFINSEPGLFAIHLSNYTGNEFEQGYFSTSVVTGNPDP